MVDDSPDSVFSSPIQVQFVPYYAVSFNLSIQELHQLSLSRAMPPTSGGTRSAYSSETALLL